MGDHNAALVHGTAGAMSGCADAIVGHPFDTVKVRTQTIRYAGGPFECLTSLVKNEGMLALYKGVRPRLVTAMIQNTVRAAARAPLGPHGVVLFAAPLGVQRRQVAHVLRHAPHSRLAPRQVLFGANGELRRLFGASADDPTSLRFAAAGAATGVVESVAFSGLEHVKGRMQLNVAGRAVGSVLGNTAALVSAHGVRGLYRGFWATCARESIGNTVYFCSYELCKKRLADALPTLPAEVPIALAGGSAGTAYWVIVHPIDTAKNLYQLEDLARPRFHSATACARHAVEQQGVQALYRGYVPSMLRSFPAYAAIFLAYEWTVSLWKG